MRCMAGQSNCDNCLHYIYNEICDWYECEVDLDEDEMGRFMQGTFRDCPYFRLDDEYGLVRKQN